MRVLIGLVFVILLIFFLANQSIENQKKVLKPSELLMFEKKNLVRVLGNVRNMRIANSGNDSFFFEFELTDDVASIKTVFSGYKPELLQEGIKAIVDGDWHSGTLYAASVLTQCPSKYEPKKIN